MENKMNYVVCIGLFVMGLIAEGRSAELPSSFKTCRRGSPNYSECVGNAVTEAIISMANGLKSFRILPVEPLEIEGVVIGAAGGGAVSLKQNFKNVKLHGLTKGLRVFDYDIDFDNLILRSNSINDQVDFVADYSVQGQILLLPIRGNGRANVTMIGLKSKNDIYCEKYEKDGETYLRVKKYDIKFNPDRVVYEFTNLFNGDPVLSAQMNRFLNANWDVVFKESQPAYEETFGLVFAKIANDIFSRVPFDQLFPM